MASVNHNRIKIEYESFGDPANPAIVLVMGLGMQLTMWPVAFCEMLVAKGFRVIRFDNRDVGLSTHLDHLGMPRIGFESIKYMMRLPVKAPYVIDDMARDTAAFLGAIGIARAHLVGASLGGMIAQNLAANEPARVATLTSIMSTTGKRSLPQPTAKARRALMMPPAKRGDVEGAITRLMNVLRDIGSTTYPAEESYLRSLCETQVRRSHDPAGVARQLVAVAASGDRTSVVRRIKAPTLVLHGDEDPLVRPACGEETARVINAAGGKARLELIRGMGHDLPVPLLPQLAEHIAAHCRAHP